VIAVDSSVLLDVISDDPRYAEASAGALSAAGEVDDVVVCDAVMAEICAYADPAEAAIEAMAEFGIRVVPVSEQAAIRAGLMLRRFRERGGGRERLIADFLIGSHALMQAGTLITRDAGFHRDYFKGLKIIDPMAS
jgi:predicted nucleic acid-binding protein